MAETLKSQSDSSIYKAQLLSYYYSRRAESAIGRGERFVMTKAYWCKSDLVTVNSAGGWTISDIPLDFKLSDAQHFAESISFFPASMVSLRLMPLFHKKRCRTIHLTISIRWFS